MLTKVLWFTLALTLTAQAVTAATVTGTNPPWQWTLEERLAARFSPTLAAARLAEAEPSASREAYRVVIEGKTNPEIFLPWELWDWFLDTSLSPDWPDRDGAVRAYQQTAEALSLPADFFERIKTLASPYLEAKNHGANEFATCRLRLATLEAARNLSPDFDRFLYEAVAPKIRFFAVGEEVSAETLRSQSLGCP